MSIPQLMPNGGEEWSNNSKTWGLRNWLQAALALEPKPTEPEAVLNYDTNLYEIEEEVEETEGFILETGVQICWVPDGEGEDAGAEIRLIISIDLLVDLATAFDPSPNERDLRGLILYSTLPAPVVPKYKSNSEARASALRFFYESVRPADDLPFTFNATQLQPKEMASKLLPFQMRTVGLLLRREGSSMMGDIKVKASDVDGLWDKVELGSEEGSLAYRRLTGEVVRLEKRDRTSGDEKSTRRGDDDEEVSGLTKKQRDELPVLLDVSGVRGTMLCEEMGEFGSARTTEC
jgi:E3 ubiquitin-protein ligase SHPRH